MAKSRDYLYKDVMNINGEKIGYIKDLLVDFGRSEVVGFKINPYKIMKKGFNVLKEDIIYQREQLIVKDTAKNKFIEFSSIMNMYVVDKCFNILGLVSEVIFDDEEFIIKGISIRDYNLWSMFKSRRILLIKELIIGEEYIFFIGDNPKITMECMPIVGSRKNLYRDVYYEKA